MKPVAAYPLAADFSTSTDAEWRTLVDGVLNGAPFGRLVGRSADGLAIQPLYAPAASSGGRAMREAPGPWGVFQRVDHPDRAVAQALALADLDGGANGLALVFQRANAAFGFGIDAKTIEQLDEILAGIELDLISLRIDAPGSGVAQARLLAGLVEKRRLVASALNIQFGCDPVGAALCTGSPGNAAGEFGAEVAGLALELRDRHFEGAVLMADGRPVHAAGGSEAQELAHVISSALFYLRLLEKNGFSLEDARQCISFMLAADVSEYLGIAKFRALRLLWARIEQACGLPPRPIRLQAETAWRMLTRRDPYVNVLRTSMAVFAAGIGGADSIAALPFTSALGLPDGFARRIARNSQLVLIEEAHLAAVADPAAGAGGFEALTQGLCEAAWALFQEIEKAGGIVAAMAAGMPQEAISKSAAARARAFATRKMPLTGTSEFPDLNENAINVLLPATPGQPPASGPFAVLVPHRDSIPFEALRDAADAFAKRTGAPPKVFLANLGALSTFAARTAFAANAFAAGGIEAAPAVGCTRADGSTDLEALIRAAVDSGAQLACLCGGDATYAAQAGAAANALAGHFRALFLAGKPLADAPPALHYIHAGCDLVAALQAAHASLEE